jgi:hypothetical protein
VDPVLKSPAVKSESQVSCVFLVWNIYLTWIGPNVRWGTCHHNRGRPQVVDGGDSL